MEINYIRDSVLVKVDIRQNQCRTNIVFDMLIHTDNQILECFYQVVLVESFLLPSWTLVPTLPFILLLNHSTPQIYSLPVISFFILRVLCWQIIYCVILEITFFRGWWWEKVFGLCPFFFWSLFFIKYHGNWLKLFIHCFAA